MSEKAQLIRLSQYNRLMNERLYAASAKLSPEAQRENKGAFFDSVIGTLNHIMVGDILWLKRFAHHPRQYQALEPIKALPSPTNLRELLFIDMQKLRRERERIDQIIMDWCKELHEDDLDQPFSYQNLAGNPYRKNFGGLVMHLFLHQVHHRGQATTLLSQEGIDFGDTDLPEIIPNEPNE